MSQYAAKSMRRFALASVAGAMVVLLALAATARANTYNATDTASFMTAVNSANANPGANTIVVAGAIYGPTRPVTFTNTSGPLTIIDQSNKTPPAKFDGGAVQPFPSSLFVINSGVTVNFVNIEVTTGGGSNISAIDSNGTANFDRSLIAGNNSNGLQIEPNATSTITNSTFSDGLAFGIVDQGSATITNSTIALNNNGGIDNSSGVLNLTNTIVAKNGPSSAPLDCLANANTADHSLDGDGSCGVGALSNKDPMLGGLVQNGGAHPTHPLKTGSPAIDAANTAKCPAIDERGVARPDDPSTPCDIGAAEWNNTPPTWSVPADMTVPGQDSSGAVVNYTATASSTDDAVTSQSCNPPSGSKFPVGTTTVNCTATDGYGATATASFKVTVTPPSSGPDTTPPTWSGVPTSPVVAEATSANGAIVNYATPNATDPDDAVASQGCAPKSGSPFPLGTTTVTCTATDTHNNTSTATFKVTVQDTTPPVIHVPNDMRVAAQDSSGAVVSYDKQVSATDAVDGTDPVSCSPASGSKFPVGTTMVTCNSSDKAGNKSNPQSFAITVDNTPPTICSGPSTASAPSSCTPPGDMTVSATGPNGATVDYTVVFDDPDDAVASSSCAPASGSNFPLGTTTVNCTAKDSVGNTANASFKITVKNTTPPSITTPGDMRVAADPTGTAIVSYTATAVDMVDGPLTPNCSPASGSVFTLGRTTVTCTATDSAGNVGTGSFYVTVDNTAPRISAPSRVNATATSPNGAPVSFNVTTSDPDPGDTASVSCSPPSGSIFPIGTTTVTCTATDSVGNTSTATFTVTVKAPTTAPSKAPGPGVPAHVMATAFTSNVERSRHGADVDVSCIGPATSECSITAQLTAWGPRAARASRLWHQIVLAKKTVKLKGGESETVHVRLGHKANILLAKRHKLGVLLEVIDNSDGWTRTTDAEHLEFRGKLHKRP